MVRHYEALMVWRFATGFFLVGIHPVGMKIAAQWYRQRVGAALAGAMAKLAEVGG